MELCTLIFNGALICLQEEKTILNTKWKELVYAYTRIYHSQNTPYRSITGQYSGKWLAKTIFDFRGKGSGMIMLSIEYKYKKYVSPQSSPM